MYGGSVISISTRERATCILRSATELVVNSSGQTGIIATKSELRLAGDKLDIAKAALTWFEIDPAEAQFSIEISTDIPMQAGMAGSTAIVVAIVGALNRWFNYGLHPWAVAETARKIENSVMGVVCGHQDQHMATFGGINYMDFAGKQDLQQRDDEPLATVEPLQDYCIAPTLIAAHTGVQHHSGYVHSSPRDRWLAGDNEVIESYCHIATLARLAKRAILNVDWVQLGELMNENHRITALLGGSGESNERLISAANSAGALGAKLAGAGGGGTVLILTERPQEMANALKLAGSDAIYYPVPMPGLIVTSRTGE